TLAQTLAKLKSAKSKVVIQEPVQSTAKIAPSTIPKAKGITFRDAGESTTRTPTSVSSLSIKDKGKAKMDEPEVPLKKKDQIALDEEIARKHEAQIQVELIKEERHVRKQEKEANIALIESWDNTQAMIETDFELAHRIQAKEQGEITIEERSRLFVELINKRKKHFTELRAEEKRKVVKSKEGTKESSKRIEDELESDKKRARKEQKQESSKRQRMKDDKEIDEHEKAKEDDEAEMKIHMEVVQDDEGIANYAIPIATKPPIIVEYKIVKEGQKGFYHLIRAGRSTNRYSSMIRMLQNISIEYLETLWKLVKTKYGNTRPKDDYEKVFWGDLTVMFKPDIKSEIWRSLQEYKVTLVEYTCTAGTKVNATRLQLLEDLLLSEG
ncbi:hypothetical protein Tco_0039876, partial [Tanacetum coccineum]